LQDDIGQRETGGLAAKPKTIADHLRDFFERVVAKVDEIVDVDV
jgi:hypothetical protein